jgi:hypothetical protein
MAALREASRLYEEETLRTGNNDFMELSADWFRELGFFPPPQGLGATNHRSVRMMIQYCYEQGLIRNLFEPEELFAAVR